MNHVPDVIHHRDFIGKKFHQVKDPGNDNHHPRAKCIQPGGRVGNPFQPDAQPHNQDGGIQVDAGGQRQRQDGGKQT